MNLGNVNTVSESSVKESERIEPEEKYESESKESQNWFVVSEFNPTSLSNWIFLVSIPVFLRFIIVNCSNLHHWGKLNQEEEGSESGGYLPKLVWIHPILIINLHDMDVVDAQSGPDLDE